jgi:hypothetical protein
MIFWHKLGDMFLDQAGGVDEKRVLGIPTIAAAVVYVLITGNLAVFAAVSGLGTLLLGIGVAGDQGKLGGGPGQGNPTQGVPQ